jgi:hypothetical protein
MAFSFSGTTNSGPQYQLNAGPSYQTNDPNANGGWGSTALPLLGAGLGVYDALSSPYGAGANGSQYGYGSQTLPWMQAQYQKSIGYDNSAAARTPGQAVAGFTPDQLAAMKAITGSATYGIGDLTGAGANSQKLAQGISAGDVQNFMSPYTQNVVNQTVDTMNRQKSIAGAGVDAAAQAANAFGGDRQAVAHSLSDQNYDNATATAVANLNNQGYQSAVNSALQNQTAKLGGNQQLTNEILARIQASQTGQNNALAVGNQQQTQNQNLDNWAIQQGQVAGAHLNNGVGTTVSGSNKGGTLQDPISGTIAGIQGGLGFGSSLAGLASKIPGLAGYFSGGGNTDAYGNSSGSSNYLNVPNVDPSQYINGGGSSGFGNIDYSWDPSTNYSAPGNTGVPDWLNFDGAGGQAAGQVASGAQSTDDSSYAGYRAPSQSGGGLNYGGALSGAGDIAGGLARGGVGGGLQAASGAGRVAGSFGNGTAGIAGNLAGNIGGIVSGVNRGGVLGYGGAGLSAAGAANNVSKLAGNGPLYSGGVGAGLGLAGNALGIVNGIKQGGVFGYGSAALNGYQGYNTAMGLYNASQAGSAAGAAGAGSGTAAGAGAGSLAAGLSGAAGVVGIAAYGAGTQPVDYGGKYWDGVYNALTSPSSDPGVPTSQAQYAAKNALYTSWVRGAPSTNDFGQKGPGLPPKIMALAQQYGMINADGSVNQQWSQLQPAAPRYSGYGKLIAPSTNTYIDPSMLSAYGSQAGPGGRAN